MKNDVLKDILLVATFTAISYIVVRNDRIKKRKDRQMRDFVHFQLF